MKAWQWIDQARLVNGWPSDYRAADELGVSRAAISIYRNKPSATMADDVALRVARATGKEPAFVVLDQVIERTKSAPARVALQQLLRRAAAVSAAGAAAAAGPRRARHAAR